MNRVLCPAAALLALRLRGVLMTAGTVLSVLTALCAAASVAADTATDTSSHTSAHTSAQTSATLRVDAPIVSVEPVYQPAPLVCDTPPPAHSEGLAATLRWDLFDRCSQDSGAPKIAGYRVSYTWDGQLFNTVVDEPPPGDTLPLSLRLQ